MYGKKIEENCRRILYYMQTSQKVHYMEAFNERQHFSYTDFSRDKNNYMET